MPTYIPSMGTRPSSIVRWVVVPTTSTTSGTIQWPGTTTTTSNTWGTPPAFWVARGFTWEEGETLEQLVGYSDAQSGGPDISRQPIASPAIIREREAIAQRRVEQMALADQECRERRERNAAAQARANELLLEHLTQEQRDTLIARGFFDVEGRSGRKYRIETNRGYTGNVVALADHRFVSAQRYCAHCDPAIAPGHDQFLAQKFMLEHAEEDFLRVANRH